MWSLHLHPVNLDLHGVELFDDYRSTGFTESGNVWLQLGAAPMVVVETLNEGQKSYLRYPVMSTYTRDHCLTMGSICRLQSSKREKYLESTLIPPIPEARHVCSHHTCFYPSHSGTILPCRAHCGEYSVRNLQRPTYQRQPTQPFLRIVSLFPPKKWTLLVYIVFGHLVAVNSHYVPSKIIEYYYY